MPASEAAERSIPTPALLDGGTPPSPLRAEEWDSPKGEEPVGPQGIHSSKASIFRHTVPSWPLTRDTCPTTGGHSVRCVAQAVVAVPWPESGGAREDLGSLKSTTAWLFGNRVRHQHIQQRASLHSRRRAGHGEARLGEPGQDSVPPAPCRTLSEYLRTWHAATGGSRPLPQLPADFCWEVKGQPGGLRLAGCQEPGLFPLGDLLGQGGRARAQPL